MRPFRILMGLLIATLVAAPMAAAQNETDIDVNPPDEVDVDVTNNDGDPDESVGFFGLSGTALIVLVVLAIIVVALIVALASRDRYP